MDLSNCCFSFAYLDKTKLNGLLIENEGIFDKYPELEVGFMNAKLNNCELCGVDSRYTDFSNAEIKNASMKGSRFYHAKLINADLSGSDLTGAVFEQADLKWAILRCVILCNTDFSKSDLRGADLRGIEFASHEDLKSFKGAIYNDDPTQNRLITKFPEDFDPKTVGMILDNSPY